MLIALTSRSADGNRCLLFKNDTVYYFPPSAAFAKPFVLIQRCEKLTGGTAVAVILIFSENLLVYIHRTSVIVHGLESLLEHTKAGLDLFDD